MSRRLHTFLFSDIVGSTRLWEAFPTVMDDVVSRHDVLVHSAVAAAGGDVYKHTGDGMGAAFGTPAEALVGALRAQQSLLSEDWGEIGQLPVRMGIHSGEAEKRDGYYFGSCLNHVARLMSAARGSQILVSRIAAMATSEAPGDCTLVDLGRKKLRDLSRPDNIFWLQHPDLPTDLPPIKSERTGNLPDSLPTLFGREHELQKLTATLAKARLVTLTGFGGTGKTSLAQALGRTVAGQYRDGVWFLPLAALTEGEVVARQGAALFGIGEAALDGWLIDKELLFIIDNCEHLLSDTAGLVSRLLVAPEVTVVATSREPLNLRDEKLFPVPPLPVPASTIDRERLSKMGAIQLFVERARAVRPSFELTDDNAADVARIVRKLDGIPLAVSLAASRAKLLSPARIADRLDECFKLLKGGARDGTPHHRTMQLAIDWSYDVLTEEEQAMFCQLSVFRGGFDLAAATAVSGADDDFEVLELLGQLADKSMVQVAPGLDDTRYRMLAPLRQYGAAHSSESMLDSAKAEHAAYYCQRAETASPELIGPRQLEWLGRLEQDHDNLRAALRWCLSADAITLGQRIASALGWFWVVRRHHHEGLQWFDKLMARTGESPTARGWMLVWASLHGMLKLDALDEPLAQAREAIALFEQASDPMGKANARMREAILVWTQRDIEASLPIFEEVRASLHTMGFAWGAAFADFYLGDVAHRQGDLVLARRKLTLAVEGCQDVGDISLEMWTLTLVARLSLFEGQLEESARVYRLALSSAEDLGDQIAVATMLVGLGHVAARSGDEVEARRLITEAQGHYREGSGGQGMAWSVHCIPVATPTHGALVEAWRRYSDALEVDPTLWCNMVLADGKAWTV